MSRYIYISAIFAHPFERNNIMYLYHCADQECGEVAGVQH